MRDLMGNELSVGDRVVVTPKNYRGLVVAEVLSFTPKQVRLGYTNTWNFGTPGRYEEYLVYPSSCVLPMKDNRE